MGFKRELLLRKDSSNSSHEVVHFENFDSIVKSIDLLYQEGKFGEAKEKVSSLTENNPGLIADHSFFVLATKIILASHQNVPIALDYLKQATLYGPNNKEVIHLQNLLFAISLYKDGAYEEGKKIFTELTKTNSSCELTNYYFGHYLLWSSREPKLAVKYLKKATSIHPNFKSAWKVLIFAQEKTGDLVGAQKSFEQFLKLPERESGLFVSSRLM